MGIFEDKKCFTDSELMEMLEEAMEVGINKAKQEFENNKLDNVDSNVIASLKDTLKQKKSRISDLTLENGNIREDNKKLNKQLFIEESNSKTFLETIYEQQQLLEKITRKLQSNDTKLYEVVNQLVVNIVLPKKETTNKIKKTEKKIISNEKKTNKPTIDTLA
jgi:hypothetical protein